MKLIFEVYICSRIFRKRELRENINNVKISTFTVCPICITVFSSGLLVSDLQNILHCVFL